MNNRQAVTVLEMIETHGSLPTKAKECAIEALKNQEAEKERIIKELEEATVIGADCFGEGFECIPKWKAIEIVKRGK